MNFVRLKMKLRKFSLWFYFDLKTIKLMSIYSPWYIQRVDKKILQVLPWKYLILLYSFYTDQDIKKLLTYFRSTFAERTFPPKLHMLEDHVVPFIRKWRFPLGFFGEQGGESIHHEFRDIANNFHHTHPASDRLQGMLERHYTVIEPENRQIIPVKQVRNLKRKSEEQHWMLYIAQPPEYETNQNFKSQNPTILVTQIVLNVLLIRTPSLNPCHGHLKMAERL